MKKILLSTILTALVPLAASAQEVKAYEGTITMPTYLLDPAEKAPVFERDWSYQRAKRSVYPYPLNDNMTRVKKDVTYDCLYLENEYVKLCVLPEIGGRLLYAVDKTNGYDIFYHNEVVKPANVGMTGAWISGGVEWNAFHHHRQTSHIPCDWKIETSDDGSKTIWIGETEYRHRMQWAIGITLHPKKSVIEISGRLINSTFNNNSMLYWSNVSTLVDENYQICFPQCTEFVTFHCKNWFAHWPVTHEPFNDMDFYADGIDASWWKNHYMSNSMFIHDQKADFVAGYDHGRNAGTMLAGNHNINKGGKFWLWGPNSEWDTKILTDNSGHYCELMVGAYSDNQPDYNWNFPYETKQFSQYWYGLRDIKGVKAGNRRAALNMEITSAGKVFIGANASEEIPGAVLTLSRGGKEIFSRKALLSPASPIVAETVTDEDVREEELTLTLTDGNGKVVASYTPLVKDPTAPLPEIVERPLLPGQIENTEECFLVGMRNLQFHNPFVNPVDYFEEVLRRDPGDTRANTQMGVYYRLRGEYAKAESYLRTAIRRQTKDYTRPKDAEALYNLGLILKLTGKREAAYDTLYRATWNYTYNSGANTQLAQMYVEDGDPESALERADEAIAYNGRNYTAINLKGSILKSLGKTAQAKECFRRVLEEDPMNAYATRETASAEAFRKFMREQPESYLELALQYLHNGFKDDAVELLRDIDSRVAYPTVKLYLGYLTSEEKYFADALALPVDYCAPFRLETIDVLKKAMEVCPESERPYYYLGNLLYNIQPDRAMEEWSKCVEMNPQDDLAWRNLGWANWLHTKDYTAAAACYRKAIELNPDAALYLEECDQVLEAGGFPVSERYEILKGHHNTAVKRYYPIAQEVVTGTYMGDYDYVLELLDKCYFPTREGVANFHDTFVDALLLAGKAKIREGLTRDAIALYKKAFTYPENHQVFLVDERATHDAQINYFLGEAYEILGEKEEAQRHYTLAADQDYNLKGSKDYRYWTALAMKKIGRKAEAKALLKAMVADGKAGVVTQFVNFYGAEGTTGRTVEAINAEAYYTRALGELGLGHRCKARRLFKKVKTLKPDHLWANEMLKNKMR